MADGTMRAWSVVRPGPVEEGSLRLVGKPVPAPADDELPVRVRACGVCRTDLHVAEGDLPVRREGVTPRHEVVGVVAGAGAAARGFAVGHRVGVAWLRRTFRRREADHQVRAPDAGRHLATAASGSSRRR